MIKVGVKIRPVKIEIETPDDPRFWKAVGLEMTKDIRKRTQDGKDIRKPPRSNVPSVAEH
jgi:phosphoribosylaminoimidazole-succinocarboxamide synthase